MRIKKEKIKYELAIKHIDIIKEEFWVNIKMNWLIYLLYFEINENIMKNHILLYCKSFVKSASFSHNLKPYFKYCNSFSGSLTYLSISRVKIFE